MRKIDLEMFQAIFYRIDFNRFIYCVKNGANINAVDPVEGLSVASGFVFWDSCDLDRALKLGVNPNIKIKMVEPH